MKAIISTRYGAPDVLQLRDIPKPTPKDNEVLVKVHASVVTPSDCAFRKGDPFIIRLIYGWNKPRLTTQGVEFSGVVEAVGKDVTRLKVGDQVFGMSPHSFGAHAEYMCLLDKEPLTLKPSNLPYEDAAGMVDGPVTALSFLRDKAKLQRGQRILINGASGSVGSAAVQIAKHYGAHVIGVCSGANVEMVKALGADAVIDYTREDFTQERGAYDVIFDAVGKNSFSRCHRALKPKGIYMTTVPTLGFLVDLLLAALMGGGKKAIFATAGLDATTAHLEDLRRLVEAGSLRAVIDRCYPLERVAEAHRYVETGRKRGNVVITI
ncbi:MAG: NAD(P)-dependent alcohol dehydrogenase [Chloroflexota bacterium]|nr:NAD(P)-dependent alcohol dehydrogenase [Chloroflexota bacterium]